MKATETNSLSNRVYSANSTCKATVVTEANPYCLARKECAKRTTRIHANKLETPTDGQLYDCQCSERQNNVGAETQCRKYSTTRTIPAHDRSTALAPVHDFQMNV